MYLRTPLTEDRKEMEEKETAVSPALVHQSMASIKRAASPATPVVAPATPKVTIVETISKVLVRDWPLSLSHDAKPCPRLSIAYSALLASHDGTEPAGDCLASARAIIHHSGQTTSPFLKESAFTDILSDSFRPMHIRPFPHHTICTRLQAAQRTPLSPWNHRTAPEPAPATASRATAKKLPMMTPADRLKERMNRTRLEQSAKRDKLILARRNIGVCCL